MTRRLIARTLRRRPPFSVALVALVVALTALTGASIGGLAWRSQRAQSRAMADAAIAQAAGLVATHAGRFLQDAEWAARLGPQLVAEGRLDAGDFGDVENFVVGVLRAHAQLTWVSYGDRDDRFVGAWRDAQGQLFVNRSFPHEGRIRLEEDQLLPDGSRTPVRRSDDHRYRPSQRPHFRAAETQRGLVWTEPYEFYASGGPGLTCAAPLLEPSGRVRGVFTVDFSLQRLAQFLDAVTVSEHGRVLLTTARGGLLAQQRRDGPGDPVTDAGLMALLRRHVTPAADGALEFVHGAEHYLARAMALPGGGPGWMVQVVVPESDYTAEVDAQARRAALLGVVALGLALAGGIAMARWTARPLRELADAALRIRQGHLDVAVHPRSRDEIGVLARAMTDMVRALRDREFIRETLGRYVSPELAGRVLRERGAVRLGGEVREVAILMSDLRGFSELSERLGPEAMIDLLNRYLGAMTRVIHDHGGMINEFIGDAILVLFGAPFQRADDSERAVQCAAAMQQALAELNATNRQLGLPELGMGIAVHVGPVVAGNIGSSDRVKYGVVGPPVNLTARLQAAAARGEVVLSAAIVERVRDLAVTAPSRIRVKGVARTVTIHRLQRPGIAGSDVPAEDAADQAGTTGDTPAPPRPNIVPLRRRTAAAPALASQGG